MDNDQNVKGGAQKAVTEALCPDCEGELVDGLCVACSLGGLMPVEGSRVSEAGAILGKYQLREKVASGGMGVVWLAEDTELKRTVAVKLIRGASFAGESERARFRVEAEAAAALDHPNIVPIYDIGLADEQPFFTMKMIDGQSLAALIAEKTEGRLAAQEAAEMMAPIASAVHHAHGRGVLHRDLKPGNVLVDKQGEVWLTDFGLAKLVDDEGRLTQTSAHLGTTHYMPPEVVRGGADAASTAGDVWSLGVILWEALYGQPPFRGSGPAEVMRKIETAQPSRPSGVPMADRDLHTLALRCMAKTPARRLPSAAALGEELDRWKRGQPIESRPVSAFERGLKWVRRNPVWAALCVAVCAGFISSFLLWKKAEGAVASLTETNDQLGRALSVSTATKLASDSRLEVGEDPTRACLLAVSAAEVTEKRGFGVLPEAAEALTEVLQKAGGEAFSPFWPMRSSYDDGILFTDWVQNWRPRYSPDGQRMAIVDPVGGQERKIAVRGVRGNIQHLWSLWGEGVVGRELCWLGDDALLTFEQQGEVTHWDLDGIERGATPAGKTVGDLESGEGDVINVRFSADRRRGVAVSRVQLAERLYDYSYRQFEIKQSSGGSVEVVVEEKIPIGRGDPDRHCVVSHDLEWMATFGAGLVLYPLRGNGLDGGQPIRLSNDSTYHCAFSHDGKWISFRSHHSGFWLFDLDGRSGGEIAESGKMLFESAAALRRAVFSPDSQYVAVGCDSSEVRVVGLNPPRLLHTLRVSRGDTQSVTFSPDSRWLAVGGTGRVVEVWPTSRLETAPRPIEFRGLQTPVLDVYFDPGGRRLIASGVSCIFRAWEFSEAGGGAMPKVVTGGVGSVLDLALSPGRRWAATARDTAKTGGQLERGGVELADLSTGESWKLCEHGPMATGVAFSVGGRWLATTGTDQFAKVWDVRRAAARLRSGEVPEAVHVFDMTDTRQPYRRRVLFHPRGLLYCATGDGVMFEWDLSQLSPVRNAYRVHSNGYLLPALTLSPDGNTLAVARHGWEPEPVEGSEQIGNMVLLLDVSQPGAPLPTTVLPANFLEVTNLDFSPDGRWLAAGSAGQHKAALVWDLTAKDIAASRIEAPSSDRQLSGVAFSPNGETLALGGTDGEILLWNRLESGGRSRTISAGDEIYSLAWLDETRLISTGGSGQIEIWETDVQRLKALAREVAGRDLLDGEIATKKW